MPLEVLAAAGDFLASELVESSNLPESDEERFAWPPFVAGNCTVIVGAMKRRVR